MSIERRASPPRADLRRLWLLPLAALLYVVAVLGHGLWRGSRVEAAIHDTVAPAEGVATQIVARPDGRIELRATAVLEGRMTAIWLLLADYTHHGEIFTTREKFRADSLPDGRFRVTGTIRSGLGRYPIDQVMTHEVSVELCRASWDAPGAEMPINRGSWTLTSAGEDQTRVVYTLEVEIAGFPQAMVRTAVLHQMAEAIASLGRYHLKSRALPAGAAS